MINQQSILNRVLQNLDPRLLSKYSQSRLLVKGILREFLQELETTRSIYRTEPDMFYMTLRMNDSFMHTIPEKQRETLIRDITFEVVARLNNHLIKHPDRTNQQQYKIRPHIVTENRDVHGAKVMEHSHSILMINPIIKRNFVHPYGSREMQFKLFDIQTISKPFDTITDNHQVHLLNDCHSIKLDFLAESTDLENVLGYDLKTCLLDDDDNSFSIYKYNSQDSYYEKKSAKR